MTTKTEVEILRDALVSIAKDDEIWRDAVNECLRVADKARVKTFTIEEVEDIAMEINTFAFVNALRGSSSEHGERLFFSTWWKDKKKQLIGESNDE